MPENMISVRLGVKKQKVREDLEEVLPLPLLATIPHVGVSGGTGQK